MNGPQAAKKAGITYRQFDHWIRRGYIAGGCPGSGRRRDISADEFDVLARMAGLVRAGVTPAAAAELARQPIKRGWWQRLRERAT